MSERDHYLHGADDVRSAASTMSSAAREMKEAASNMDSALERHRTFMDNWLREFEEIVERMRPIIVGGPQ